VSELGKQNETLVPSPKAFIEKLPIKDCKEAIVAGVALAMVGVGFYKDRNIDFKQLLIAMSKVQQAIDGFENIIPEALDMDSEEAKEVIAAVAAEINVSNEKAKTIILASLESLPANIKLVKAITA
jgi:hypothetical protein